MTHDHTLMRNAVRKGSVLIVATSCDQLAGEPTGVWLSEIAIPYVIFMSSGLDVTIASIKGGVVPVDKVSEKEAEGDKAPPELMRFLKDDAAQQAMRASVPLEKVERITGFYDAIFLPGGHGAGVDLHTSAKLRSLLAEAYNAGCVVAALCHGPAGLVGVTQSPDGKGEPLVKGKRVACFSNEEERKMGKDKVVPFLLEDKLRELGANVETGPAMGEFAIVDGRLITGQNPASAYRTASLVVEALTANYPEGQQGSPIPHVGTTVTSAHHPPGSMRGAEVAQLLGVHSNVSPTSTSSARTGAGDMDTDIMEPSMEDNLGENAAPPASMHTGGSALA